MRTRLAALLVTTAFVATLAGPLADAAGASGLSHTKEKCPAAMSLIENHCKK
jgi:hypothetical protein